MKSVEPDLLSRLYVNWNTADSNPLRELCGEAHDEIARLRQENEKLRAQRAPWTVSGICEVCKLPVGPPTNRYMGPAFVINDRIWHSHCFPPKGVSGTVTLGAESGVSIPGEKP